ncbi:hypothetical protein IFM47457_02032 [Aspergillus lentulus]|nr:hypothetical protein IFM47457_02032 [Aspergillus lentulus]
MAFNSPRVGLQTLRRMELSIVLRHNERLLARVPRPAMKGGTAKKPRGRKEASQHETEQTLEESHLETTGSSEAARTCFTAGAMKTAN